MTTGFRLPNEKQRTLVLGKTGSGKTQFGAWLLSKAAFDKMPWVIVDFKGDELLGSIDRVRQIGYSEVPKHPGLYYLRAMPGDEEQIEDFMWRIWKRRKVGLFFDEGYMVPGNGQIHGRSYKTLLTQGRSLRVPVITLSQRPAWLSRFAFSEANQFAVFHLNDERDFKTVSAFTPKDAVWTTERLPKYHSRWYDVDNDFSAILEPVPKGDELLERFNDRLRSMKRML